MAQKFKSELVRKNTSVETGFGPLLVITKIQIIVKFGTLVLAFRPSDLDPIIQLVAILKLILTFSKQF